MKKLIAHCGLDCEKCDARIATLTRCQPRVQHGLVSGNDDNILRKKVVRLWLAMNDCHTVGMVISNNAEALSNLKNKQ